MTQAKAATTPEKNLIRLGGKNVSPAPQPTPTATTKRCKRKSLRIIFRPCTKIAE